MKLFILGIFLVLVSWFISWTRFTFLYEHAFFPLWLGYILTLNGISEIIFKKSLISELKYKFIFLFLISIPMWWYFEFLNHFLQNWHYLLNRPISNLEFNIRASIDFSTVVPAVLSTMFIFKSFLLSLNMGQGKKFNISFLLAWTLILVGVLFSISLFFAPRQTFPLVWISAFLIIDPLNYLLGFPSVIRQLSKGVRINFYSVVFAALFTGFWWEMWNYYSLPKWYYTIPYVGFYKVFEMPILGYLGYLPFGLEILAFVYFCFGLASKLGIKTETSLSENEQ